MKKSSNKRNSDVEESSGGTKVINWNEQPTTFLLPKSKLMIIDGINKGKEFKLQNGTITIGSRPDQDLYLDDETVSRNHAEIKMQNEGYVLLDLGSTNGTFIDGIKVKEAYLKPGSIIKIGKTEIKFVPEDEKIEIYPSKKNRYGDLIGRSVAMRRIYSIIDKIAPTEATVIVEGETGTGKELIAKMVHQKSKRAKKPFVVFDCSAIAENLIESELFGHERGAFTGAVGTRQGAFELADGGTIFLDEIGELNIDLQPKLLRVLESRTVKRVGGDKQLPVDVRVIAATNRNLENEVKKGGFRQDLFYRLNVVPINIQPLRKRKDDIEDLVSAFLKQHNARLDQSEKPIKGISEGALQVLKNYDWPGNIRELRNVVNRAISFLESDIIGEDDIPEKVRNLATTETLSMDGNLPFKEAKDKIISSFEKQYLIELLKRNNMNISQAAKEGGIDRKSVQRLVKKYGLKMDESS